jgi:branched-chain amino acid transport system substrate-binding protein
MQGVMFRFLALVFLLALGASSAGAQPPIKIGLLVATTGGPAMIGNSIRSGVQLNVDELNERGGLLGRRVEVVVRDTQGKPDMAASAAEKLVTLEKVDALMGGLSSAEALAVTEVAKQAKILYIETLARSNLLTDAKRIHPFIFRVGGSHRSEGRAVAELIGVWKVGTVGIARSDDAFGKETAEAFREHLKRISAATAVADETPIVEKEAGVRTAVNGLVAKKVDAVFLVLSPRIFQALAHELEILASGKVRLVAAGEVASPVVIDAMGGKYPEGIVANTPDHPNWDNGCTGSGCNEISGVHAEYVRRLRAFLAKQGDDKERRGKETWALNGYIGMEVLKTGVIAAGKLAGDDVAGKLRGMTVRTPLGPLQINRNSHELNRGEFFGRVVRDKDNRLRIDPSALYVRVPAE